MDENNKSIKRMRGIGVSEGIAFAKVFLLERERTTIPHKIIPVNEVENEVERFREALQRARQSLSEIKESLEQARSREPSFIIDAHLMMLEDDLLTEGVADLIRNEGINAEWALRKKVGELSAVFAGMKDPYLRERGHDVEEVAERVIRELVGRNSELLAEIAEPTIVVAHELTPAETAHMAVNKVIGFATDIGSPTSHAAIMAKGLRIPAVVGLKNATREINHDDTILIDGHAGEVVVNPSGQVVEEYESRRKWLEEMKLVLAKYKDLPSVTQDGHEVTLAANIEMIQEIEFLEESGAQGVGLYRTEYLYLDRDGLPSEEEHYKSYREVIERTAPHGATIRTLDLGGDKFKSALSLADEINPAMGLRAIRLCLHNPDLFKDQLRAILRASAHGKARVMFPMVSGHREFARAKELLSEAAEELDKKGMPFDPNIEVGIMIEVPSAAFMAETLADEADFFSVGTNDLIQYTLAIDRVNESVNYLYQPLHPAILKIVREVVKAGKSAGIPVYMCGAMAAVPDFLPVLLGLGLDGLSMPMGSILRIKRILRSIKKQDAEALTDELLQMRTVDQIKERVKKDIQTRWAEVYALELEAFSQEEESY